MARRRYKRSKHMIILRGMPGVGKSRRAKEILDDYYEYKGKEGQIFSSDRYHEQTNYNERDFPANHKKNIDDVWDAIQMKVDPIIIDNINITLWEMRPYVLMGYHGMYKVIIKDVPKGYPDNFIPIEELHRWCGGLIPMKKFRFWREAYEPAADFRTVLWGA